MSGIKAVIAGNKMAYIQGGGLLRMGSEVVAIESFAFSNCPDVEEISIPDSVMLIGWNAFSNTTWFDSQPDGLVYAGRVAYAYKGEMPPDTHITLREDTVGIAGGAFRFYKNLTGITIPNGVKVIGNIAFMGCENLTDINIPDSVFYVEQLAFHDTAWYDSQPDGVVYAGKVAYSFKGDIPRDAHIVIKDGTVSITDRAIANAEKLHRLRSITIPDSVTDIGDDLVTNCAEDYRDSVMIRCSKDSFAHEYAEKNGISVELI